MKYILIIGVFICSNLNAQIENYFYYQKRINQAELNLIRGQKNESLDKKE